MHRKGAAKRFYICNCICRLSHHCLVVVLNFLWLMWKTKRSIIFTTLYSFLTAYVRLVWNIIGTKGSSSLLTTCSDIIIVSCKVPHDRSYQLLQETRWTHWTCFNLLLEVYFCLTLQRNVESMLYSSKWEIVYHWAKGKQNTQHTPNLLLYLVDILLPITIILNMKRCHITKVFYMKLKLSLDREV